MHTWAQVPHAHAHLKANAHALADFAAACTGLCMLQGVLKGRAIYADRLWLQATVSIHHIHSAFVPPACLGDVLESAYAKQM